MGVGGGIVIKSNLSLNAGLNIGLLFVVEMGILQKLESTDFHVVALATTKLQEFTVTSCNTTQGTNVTVLPGKDRGNQLIPHLESTHLST